MMEFRSPAGECQIDNDQAIIYDFPAEYLSRKYEQDCWNLNRFSTMLACLTLDFMLKYCNTLLPKYQLLS